MVEMEKKSFQGSRKSKRGKVSNEKVLKRNEGGMIVESIQNDHQAIEFDNVENDDLRGRIPVSPILSQDDRDFDPEMIMDEGHLGQPFSSHSESAANSSVQDPHPLEPLSMAWTKTMFSRATQFGVETAMDIAHKTKQDLGERYQALWSKVKERPINSVLGVVGVGLTWARILPHKRR